VAKYILAFKITALMVMHAKKLPRLADRYIHVLCSTLLYLNLNLNLMR